MNTAALNPPNRRLSIVTAPSLLELYSDSRTHAYQGPTRNVRFPRATPSGGGVIAKSEDGLRCAVTGRESLRIIRISEPSQQRSPEHKSTVGRGGHRIDASRNFWEGSGLKIDSASTDVAWGHGVFNNKILTSARNGELIMWDLNKSGSTKYERRSKDHIRSIHKLSVSHVVQHYCITGSADGDLRVWDLRDLSRSLIRIHHPTSVRSVVFSPSLWQPLQAVAGLDNGSIYRWDLKMGQRGQLDRLPVAHSGSVTTLDWCSATGATTQATTNSGGVGDGVGNGHGWIVSGGLDRCVKVWDLTAPGTSTHIPHKPTYTLYPSFPVRRVLWRPSYECELAVVSNAEFGTGSNPDMSQNNMAGSSGSGGIQRSASSLALESMLGSGFGFGVGGDGSVGTSGREKPMVESKSTGGDAVEIWDVRRGWIAKWSVAGSAVEGGVTDIAFGDSHAIWAQHSSGVFSQIDLRDSTKPIDAFPRVAATWEASGSLAFVADRKTQWETPYDDVKPAERVTAEERKSKIKALGDPPCTPLSQNMGTYTDEDSRQNLNTFTRLARGYAFEGEDRRKICAVNAEAAFQAGKDRAAQVWLLMGISLTDLVPELPPTPHSSPPHTNRGPLSHSVSAPAAIPSVYSLPLSSASASDHIGRSSESSPAVVQKTSPGRTSTHSLDRSISARIKRSSSTSKSRKMTPTSSNSSSPHLAPGALPPITPRPPSLLGRRESVDAGLIRRGSVFRRPSVSAPSTHSASPSDKSNPSLRHVGEGALDDSDSSGSGSGGDGDGNGIGGSSDEETSLRPLISPALVPVRIAPAHPSPLSRVAGQHQWTEDEEEEDVNDDEDASPSPRSTDTESGGSSSPHRRPQSGRTSRRTSQRVKTRSRSSTVASLAAPTFPKTLMKQDSHSSIRTVTAGEVSFRDQDQVKSLKPEETSRDIRGGPGSLNQKSQALSEFALDLDSDEEIEEIIDLAKLTDRRAEIVSAEENKFREMGWDVLRQALESFADEGDVQMCAMLAVVAPQELRIEKKRIGRFLDAYIELLTRLRLYTCTAYLRKYSQAEDIRSATLLETTIYTSCGKCRKPLMVAAGAHLQGELSKGGYSYCLSCKTSCVTCAICRLPVRALLFQCSVCNHGGHQACYRRYYMERPMVDLPTSFVPSAELRGRPVARNGPLGGEETDGPAAVEFSAESSPHIRQHGKLVGHPCAAGCGHFCWAANGMSED